MHAWVWEGLGAESVWARHLANRRDAVVSKEAVSEPCLPVGYRARG